MTPAERKAVIGFLSQKYLWQAIRMGRYRHGTRSGGYRSGSNDMLAAAARWLLRLRRESRLVGSQRGNSILRVPVNRWGYLFQDARGPNRRLLVGWPGMARRLMMPVANWLPGLQELDTDLLLFRRPRQRSQQVQLKWNDDSLDIAPQTIERLVEGSHYESVSVIGTSLGAMPALRYSTTFSVSRAVIVGLSSESLFASGFLEAAGSLRYSTRSDFLTFSYGMKSESDALGAQLAAEHFGGKVLPVANEEHAPVWGLLKRGEFEGWLLETLG